MGVFDLMACLRTSKGSLVVELIVELRAMLTWCGGNYNTTETNSGTEGLSDPQRTYIHRPLGTPGKLFTHGLIYRNAMSSLK